MAAMRCDIRLYWTGLRGNVGRAERGHEFVAEIVGLQVLFNGFESDSMGLMILMLIGAILCSSLRPHLSWGEGCCLVGAEDWNN